MLVERMLLWVIVVLKLMDSGLTDDTGTVLLAFVELVWYSTGPASMISCSDSEGVTPESLQSPWADVILVA